MFQFLFHNPYTNTQQAISKIIAKLDSIPYATQTNKTVRNTSPIASVSGLDNTQGHSTKAKD